MRSKNKFGYLNELIMKTVIKIIIGLVLTYVFSSCSVMDHYHTPEQMASAATRNVLKRYDLSKDQLTQLAEVNYKFAQEYDTLEKAKVKDPVVIYNVQKIWLEEVNKILINK